MNSWSVLDLHNFIDIHIPNIPQNKNSRNSGRGFFLFQRFSIGSNISGSLVSIRPIPGRILEDIFSLFYDASYSPISNGERDLGDIIIFGIERRLRSDRKIWFQTAEFWYVPIILFPILFIVSIYRRYCIVALVLVLLGHLYPPIRMNIERDFPILKRWMLSSN